MKKYPAKYTCNKILDHEEPVPALVLILAMLLSLLLLENVSNPESATSLDNSSSVFFVTTTPTEEEDVEHDAKTLCLPVPSFIFAPFFTMSRSSCVKQYGKHHRKK